MANHLRAELVVDALETAAGRRCPKDVIHHGDQGPQRTSMGFVGDAHDNAVCESLSATPGCELLDRRRSASQAEARMARFSFIEGWHNPVRLRSALGCRSPMAHEAMTEAATAEH